MSKDPCLGCDKTMTRNTRKLKFYDKNGKYEHFEIVHNDPKCIAEATRRVEYMYGLRGHK